MTNTSVSNTAYILKTLWPQDRINNMVYEDNPFLAMLTKPDDFYGENMYIALRYTNNKGRSADFTIAQANKAPHKGVRFLLTRGKDNALFGIEHEMIMAAKKDKGSLVRALETEVSSTISALTNSMALALWGDASGARGQLLSDPGTGVDATLLNINDIVNFDVGDKIVFAATKTGALRAGGARTILSIDRDLGTFSVTAAFDAALGASDYIFHEGDARNTGSAVLPTGVLGWLPSSAPTSGDSHFGVDRSLDAVRLAGLRCDMSALSPEEGLATMLTRLDREKGRPSHIFRNPIDYKNIVLALGTKAVSEYQAVGEIGFETIKVHGPKGTVRIYSDRNLTAGRGFTLTMKTWKFHTMGAAPMRIDEDGNDITREATSNGFEGRMIYYGQLACDAPGWNANETLPS